MGILNRKSRKRRAMGLGLGDHRGSPRPAEEQEAPEPERLTRPDEEAEVAVHQLERPPQAEGER
ncbi:MAG: hypothetical protein ACT443_14300 [Gemmatimonadota bacterium]